MIPPTSVTIVILMQASEHAASLRMEEEFNALPMFLLIAHRTSMISVAADEMMMFGIVVSGCECLTSSVTLAAIVPAVRTKNESPIRTVTFRSLSRFFVPTPRFLSKLKNIQRTNAAEATSMKDWTPKRSRLIESTSAPKIIDTIPSAMLYRMLKIEIAIAAVTYLLLISVSIRDGGCLLPELL